jgi:hypothetical protein
LTVADLPNGYISQSGQDVVLGNIEANTITADELYITETTRSVLYESGSTKFGDTQDDTHQFTGSFSITGSSATWNGYPWFTGSATVTSQDVITPSTGSSTEGTLYDWQNIQESIGIIDGGEVTDNGDGTVTINSGSLFIKSTDDVRGEMLISTFPSASSLTVNPTDLQVYFYVDYNVGTPTILSSSVSPDGDDTKVLLASVVREDPTELHIADKLKHIGYSGVDLLQQRYRAVDTFERESGALPSISSSLYINITAGEWWQGLTEFTTPSIDTFDTTFEYHYQSASIWKSFDANQLDNTIYNDTSTGTTASLSPNNYAVHWLYLETDGDVVAILGTQAHSNLANAEDEVAPATTPAHVNREHAKLIARIITKEGDIYKVVKLVSIII